MIKSMTGFGQAETRNDRWVVRAEVSSVNHRELKISFRCPGALQLREVELQKRLEKQVSRGHVYVRVNCRPAGERAEALIDPERVGGYLRALSEVAEREGVPFRADLAALLRLPGAMRDLESDEELGESLWPQVLETIDRAVEDLVAMRRREGESLLAHLTELARSIEASVEAIEGEQEGFLPGYRDRLRERINRMLEGSGIEVDDGALAREVAIYADRCDVSEEIARLRSHVAQLGEALAEERGAPVGRKLEFLGQEMLREAGTIAAKVPAGPQVARVLEIKSDVERLREQVRNVE